MYARRIRALLCVSALIDATVQLGCFARVRFCLFLAGAALLAACDDDAIVASALIAADPPSIDFGAVPTSETRVRSLRISNAAPTATLHVQKIRIAEGSSPAFAVDDEAFELSVGAERIIAVRYLAADSEPAAGFIEIESDAGDFPLLRVPLSSARTFPKIAVFPERLELGALASGDTAERTLEIRSAGEGTLSLGRLSLRTEGFAGDACARDGECREGRCTTSASGKICATSCEMNEACAAGYECTLGTDGARACRESAGTGPKISGRGFSFDPAELPHPRTLLPGTSRTLTVRYAPNAGDRGAAELVIESDDADRPLLSVPIFGRPDNLPPIAAAMFDGAAPAMVLPGTRIALDGSGSRDPEGAELTYAWRFVQRPEGSRASFEDDSAEKTAFTVDHPGRYLVHLEARDERRLASTNDARVEVSATAGQRIRMALSWDREESDLDLHFVSPGAPVGSLGDCFYENPMPDWAPAGPGGDPVLTTSMLGEAIAVESPAPGVYTLTVRAIAPATSGNTLASVAIFLEDVEAARFEVVLSPASESWDVATLTWPSGQLTALGTIR